MYKVHKSTFCCGKKNDKVHVSTLVYVFTEEINNFDIHAV